MTTAAPPPRRPIVLRADRDTLVLLAATGGLTLALAYSVHNRPVPPNVTTPVVAEEVAVGGWAGELAALQPAVPAGPAPAEPLSSAAMTVPKAAMALPVAPPGPAVKPRPCDKAACPSPARPPTVAALLSPSPAASLPGTSRRAAGTPSRSTRSASLVEQLNPMNHLPEIVTRPLASAGDTIVAWVKRF